MWCINYVLYMYLSIIYMWESSEKIELWTTSLSG